MPHWTRLVKFGLFFICFFILSGDVGANSSVQKEFNPFQENVISSDEEIREIVAVFLQEGKSAYSKNQISRAIDHFSRALLLDPSQKTARRFLIQINQHRGLSAKQRAELFLFEDLTAFLDKLQQEEETLLRKCGDLVEEAVRAGGDRSLFEDALDQEVDQFYFPDEGWDVWDDTRSPLEALNAALMKMKEDLSDQLSFLREKSEWLRRGAWKTASVVSVLPSDDKNAAAALVEFLIPTPHLEEGPARTGIAVEAVPAPAVSVPADEVALLRDGLRELKKEVDGLRVDVQAKDAKIARLSDQVVAFSLRLAEQEMVLSEKARLTDALRDQYADLESRFELGQKIIEEKNAQIQSLQEGLVSLQAEAAVHQKELSGMLVLKDGQVDELTGVVHIYKDKLVDAHNRLERKQVSISNLELEVDAMRVALFEKETALNKTKERVNRLEEQLHNAPTASGRRLRKSSWNRNREKIRGGRIPDLGLGWRDTSGFMSRQAGGIE